ncbi:MAG: Uma2 family endonuclease [Rudanella sp.]|nr:Uma2 family endonuclease [Rudanella sp.]
MEVAEKIQLTEAQIAVLNGGETVVMPATCEEFEDFLAETSYRTEYNNDHICIMGLATVIHEILVIRLGYLLTGFYLDKPYYVAGSNTGIRKDSVRGHYNGDVVVIKGKPQYEGRSRSIITNPFLIVEVLSESTSDFDLGEKRRKYERMNSVQEIIFVDPFEKEVLVCKRTEQPNVWTETTFFQDTDLVKMDGFTVPLSTIFANLPEEDD